MSKSKPTDVMVKIVDLLTPLASEDRQRAVNAAMTLLGETLVSAAAKRETGGDDKGEPTELPHRARAWMKQNGLTIDNLHQVFLIAPDGAEVIASEIPGKSDKEKTHNAYLLEGIAKLLSSGDAKFDDKAGRALCNKSGCFNGANHSVYMKGMGNAISGSKKKGWTLTAPGLKRAAGLVKTLTE